MNAYIVRHGNTFAAGETPRRIGARTDPALVESGRAQALALRDMFRVQGVVFDRCLVSPLLRTRETAAIILDGTIEPVPADWLREIDHGPDENRTEADVIARIGADALAAWEEHAAPPPGWIVDSDDRIAAWRAFFVSPARANTLLVTSNGAALFARLALGFSPAKMRTGTYSTVTWDRDKFYISWDIRPA